MTYLITTENLESVLNEYDLSLELLNQLFSKTEITNMIVQANNLNDPQRYFCGWVKDAELEGIADSVVSLRTNDWDYGRE
jgi:hypothetical protein